MCACTEPVRTGIDAVCVEYGRPKWPITMLNQTRTCKRKCFFLFSFFWHPMLVRPATKRPFCLKAKNRLGRSAASALPHYYYTSYIIVLIFLTQVLLLVYMPATLCSTKFVCPVLLYIHILYHQSACFPSIRTAASINTRTRLLRTHQL